MAFNAQFFQLNPTTNLADDMKGGYEAGLGIREAERKKALQDTYSKMLTSAGTLPTEFIQAAANKGLGIEGLTQYFENLKGNVGTAKQVAEDSAMLDMLGRSADVGREWDKTLPKAPSNKSNLMEQKPSNLMEQKPSNLMEQKPTNDFNSLSYEQLAEKEKELLSRVNTIDTNFTNNIIKENENLPIDERVKNLLKYTENPQGKKVETPIIQVEAPEGYTQESPKKEQQENNKEMDLGYGKIIATTPEDTRQYSAVEEMLRRKEGDGLGFGISTSVTDGFNSDNTDWVPKDDNTNQYRMFASALSNELSANGYSSPKDYLTKLGKAVYNQNLYVPNKMAIYGKDGKLDRAAVGAEKAKYEQSKIVAQAKADEAIMKARNDLTEKANKYGITIADQNKTELGGNIRLRDSSYRPYASALLTNNVLIDETGKELGAATGDIQKLSLIAPSVIRAISTASNPNAQLSEGTLHENAQKLATSITDDPNLAMKIVGSILLIPKDGGKALKNLIVSSANMFNPNVFQERLSKMLHEAKLMNNKGLETYTYYKTKEEPKEEPKETEFKTKDWFNSKPGSVGFESLAGNKYKVTGRDSFNFPNTAVDREGNKYKLIEGPDGIRIEEIVTDEGPSAASPRKTGGKKTMPKKRTW